LWKIVTDDEKIFYDNPKRKKSVDKSQLITTSIAKSKRFGKKVLFCI